MNWEKVALGDLITISKGKKHSETNDEADYRYLQIEDLNGHFTKKYTNEKGTFVNEKDIIIVWDGANAGKVGCGFKGVIGSTLARLSFKKENIDTRFVKRYLDYKFEYIKSKRTGATIPHVSTEALKCLEVPLPSFDVQKKIAALLDQADVLRQKDQLLLKKYDELLQSVFYKMFGNPSKNEKGFKAIKLDEIILEGPQNGLYKHSSEYGEGSPILRIDSFYGGVVTGLNKLKKVKVSAEELDIYGIHKNDIVINRVNSLSHLGKSAIIPELNERTVFESNMMRFKVDETLILPRFLVAMLIHPFVKMQILSCAKNAVNQSSINQKDVKSFEVLLPPMSTQKEYVSMVDNLEKQKTFLEKGCIYSEMLFQSLLQKAFNGELVK